jgi:hypothetical protein
LLLRPWWEREGGILYWLGSLPFAGTLVWQCSKLKHGTAELRLAGFPEHAARESTTFLLGFDTIICYDSLEDELLAWKDMVTGIGCYEIPMWTRGNGLPAWTEETENQVPDSQDHYILSQFSSRRELWSET